MTIRFLDLAEVLEIHQSRVELYTGTHGIRDVGLLQSALAQPMAGFGGQYFHADIFEMAAAYLFHLSRNHAFIDGNKRTALACSLVFLAYNLIEIKAPLNQLEELTVEAAQGAISKEQIAEFFRKYKA